MIKPIQDPITGKEAQRDLKLPSDALVQFYRAFNTGDMKEMSENWEQSDDISMDNPLGGIKRGWIEISALYEKIFKGSATVYVEYYDYTIHEHSDVFYAVGRERGFFELGDKRVDLIIRTSRVFRRLRSVWKKVHHHGSIEDAELLANYQSTVLGK